MAAHSLETLLRLWTLDKITPEQAIGQILQILSELEPRVKRLEQAATPAPVPTPPPLSPPHANLPAAPPATPNYFPRRRKHAPKGS